MTKPARARSAMLAGAGLLLLTGCFERPPMREQQLGYRGVGMEEVTNPRLDRALVAANQLPAALPAVEPGPPGAWQNVQVLTDIGAAEFTRTMTAMSEWLVPDSWVDGSDIKRANKCAYCHNIANMASDELYTKVVARRMLQMTRDINANYTNHVQQTGVTCYTCHRGNPVPKNIWFYTDQNQPLRYYLDRPDVRVQSASFVPSNANRSSIKQTEYTYAVMLNMSNALGVNCGYCHNSRQWSDWTQSTPQRMTALRGARMVRDLNTNYLVPLQDVWPAHRLGPNGDGAKLQCATCHNGVFKPLYGQQMAKAYPAMWAGGMGSVAAPAKMVTCALPTGEEINVAETGIECRLHKFITDASRPADKTTWFDFDRLLFATDSAHLLPASQEQLQHVANILKAYPNVKAKVGGYTDNTGDPAYNMKLSDARAQNVRQALIDLGVDGGRLEAEGYGEQYPVGDNNTPEGRQQNRRISLRVTEK